MQEQLAGSAKFYRDALLGDVIPFWEKYSIDRECGGYLTCLDREGKVFDTDKFVWLQARQVWMFSALYDRLEKRKEWLDIARHGAQFLRENGTDDEGNWYFSLDRKGQPLIQPYNIFSDCFAAMAFSQYAKVSGDDDARAIAEKTYQNILRRKNDPKGKYDKTVPGSRPTVSLALPMILANLSVELDWLLPEETVAQATDACLDEIFSLFLEPELGILHEHVAPNGRLLDTFDGRLINPGHGIEAMWFVMDIAHRRGDIALVNKAVDVALRTLEFGWDLDHGGIFYFLDAEGRPPQQLEWNQKLWWVHLETLVALLMGYRLTGRSECCDLYKQVHAYAWDHFPDPDHGEWFGYLTREGKPLLPLKGGKWKGCFHVPRALYLCMREFEQMSADAVESGR